MNADKPKTAELLTEAVTLLARLRGSVSHMATAAEESAIEDLANGLDDLLADASSYLDRMAEQAMDNVLLLRGRGVGYEEAETLQYLAQVAKPKKVSA
jgi:hypothetical protein